MNNIPKGYKLVPVEPTEEMLEVLHGSVKIQVDTWERTADIINDKEWWSAVVDSAPTPPQPIYDEAKERALFKHEMLTTNGAEYLDEIEGVFINDNINKIFSGWLLCAQSRAKAREVSP